MDHLPKFKPSPNLKLMDQVRQVLRYHHYALNTERTYCQWILRYIRHYGARRHPREMGATEVEAFLSHLATTEQVAAATQRQALNAIIFLYKQVLDMDIGDSISPVRAKRRRRLPVVMTGAETRQVLDHMQGQHLLMAELLYGAGLRRAECLRLRVNSVDLERRLLYVRFGKGGKDRVLPLPATLQTRLGAQIAMVKRYHRQDLADGFGEAWLPDAFIRKIGSAAKDLGWQYLFPAKKRSVDPRSGRERRHHVLASGLQKAVRTAVRRAGLTKRITCHTFRHSYATHLLEDGVNIRMVQELMGHADVKTTEIYTHVMQKDVSAVHSPLDRLRTAPPA
ncbi:MAG: integron integrase [Desulfosarcinaceae bacterium]|nr:integron integrase [Desulfosarcinaceae bacterium]